jgi:hypothetical protein
MTFDYKKKIAGSRGRSIYFDGEDLTHRIIGLRVLLMLREILEDA